MTNGFTRRKWGERAVEAARKKVEQRKKFLLVNAFCGSGKTLTFLDICNELYQRGVIDMVLALTPRINLCGQYETTWNKFRPVFGSNALGRVCYRRNDPPLVQECLFGERQDGVAQTYPSLASGFKLYEDLCKRYRVALVADEAQILGSTFEAERDVTRAAELVRQLHDLAQFTILGTGTADRSDGNPLLLCADLYGPPGTDGTRPLLADVEASYSEGVVEGYLRPIQGILTDGKAIREYLDDGGKEQLILSRMDFGMSGILTHQEFWRPMVDMAVEKVREVRAIDGRYCLLIGACNQAHAKAIATYCRKRHRDLGCLLAVSDEPEANINLGQFKKGDHAILITVGMAYVGYDHPWISVVLCLGAFRYPGWLDQFAFRGGRVVPERPLDEQTLWVVGPDDRPFRKWLDLRRTDSQQGLKERQARAASEGPAEPPQERLSILVDVKPTDSTAMGMDPDLDLDPEQFAAIEQIRKQNDLGAVNPGKLYDFLKSQGIDPLKSGVVAPRPTIQQPPPTEINITDEDRRQAIRAELRSIANQIDSAIRETYPGAEYGWAYQQINDHFGCRIGDQGCGSALLANALAWAKNTLLPTVLTWKQASA